MNAPYQSSMPDAAAANVPYRATGPAPSFAPMGAGTRWVFAAIAAFMTLGFFGAAGLWAAGIIVGANSERGQPDDTLMGLGMVAFMVVILLLYAQIAAGLVWLYKAWSWLPWDQRYTRHWRSWLTPGQVALFMLIPYFHYYWMFVANCGLCDALDRLRVSYPTREPAPKTLAIIACIMQLVVPVPVGTILWLVFMTKVERMTREMSAAMGPRHAQAF